MSTANVAIVNNNTYQMQGARIVSVGVRVKYTGPVNTCAGLIRVYENPIYLDPNFMVTTAAGSTTAVPAGTSLYSRTEQGNAAGYPGGTPFVQCNTSTATDGGIFAASPPPTHAVFRPEQGVNAVLKRSNTTFETSTWMDTPLGVTATNPGGTGNKAYYNIIQVGRNIGGGLNMFDNSHKAIQMDFTGLNEDMSYVVDTCVCLEAQPIPSSVLYEAAKPPVKADAALLRSVADMENKAPIARSEH
jgi:hypothetical protein